MQLRYVSSLLFSLEILNYLSTVSQISRHHDYWGFDDRDGRGETYFLAQAALCSSGA